MTQPTPYIGSKINLISNLDIRYEGILYTVDVADSTIALAKVRSFGTEDRPTANPVPSRDEIYEFIIFKAADIKDLIVCETPKQVPQLPVGLAYDPAIVTVSQSHAPREPSFHTNTVGAGSSKSALVTGIVGNCAPPPVQNWRGVGRGNAVSRQMDDAELSERNRYWNAGYKPTYNQFSYMQGYNRNIPRGNYNQRNARQQNVPRGHDRVPVRRDYSYCGDYDFEKANELFKEAIDNVVDDLAAANLDGSACKDNNVEEDVPKLIKDGKENIESVDKKDSKKFYDKSSSFFDRISCEALEPKDQKIRVDWRKEQETNQQTFGSTAVRSGNFRRGHSQYTNRGGRGMGGNRGGYNNYQVNMPQRFARGGMSFGSYNNLYSNGNRRRNNYTLQ